MKNIDLLIIGGGSAGMASAVSAYDNGIDNILILEKGDRLGGILNQCIHNGFGLTEFKEELTGPEFLSRFVHQIESRRIQYKLNSFVLSISKDKIVTYTNEIDGVVEIKAKAIIYAVGCYERNAGAILLPGDRPSGIFTAGTAQLYLNHYGLLVGKRVFILGSGDIGLIMARRMTLEGAKVLGVAEILPYSNGLNRNIVQCLNDYNIPLYLSTTVSKVIGKSSLERIEVSQVDDKLSIIPGTAKSIDVDVLLLSVGLIPNNTLIENAGVRVSKTRGAEVNQLMETSIPGIFSCGNVLHVHDLVDNVVNEARIAGKGASDFIKNKLVASKETIKCVFGHGVNYVLPQIIDVKNIDEFVYIKFRVSKPQNNAYIVFTLSGKEIKRVFKPYLLPSEMVIIKLDKGLFSEPSGELIVSLEEKKI